MFLIVVERSLLAHTHTHTEPEQFKSFLIRCGEKVSLLLLPHLLFLRPALPLTALVSCALIVIRCFSFAALFVIFIGICNRPAMRDETNENERASAAKASIENVYIGKIKQTGEDGRTKQKKYK